MSASSTRGTTIYFSEKVKGKIHVVRIGYIDRAGLIYQCLSAHPHGTWHLEELDFNVDECGRDLVAGNVIGQITPKPLLANKYERAHLICKGQTCDSKIKFGRVTPDHPNKSCGAYSLRGMPYTGTFNSAHPRLQIASLQQAHPDNHEGIFVRSNNEFAMAGLSAFAYVSDAHYSTVKVTYSNFLRKAINHKVGEKQSGLIHHKHTIVPSNRPLSLLGFCIAEIHKTAQSQMPLLVNDDGDDQAGYIFRQVPIYDLNHHPVYAYGFAKEGEDEVFEFLLVRWTTGPSYYGIRITVAKSSRHVAVWVNGTSTKTGELIVFDGTEIGQRSRAQESGWLASVIRDELRNGHMFPSEDIINST